MDGMKRQEAVMIAVTPPAAPPAAPPPLTTEVRRWKFTADDYMRMGETGILDEDDRVELIDGEVLVMSPIGVKHMAIVNWLTTRLVPLVGANGIVSIQNPVRLDRFNVPQPDVVILKPRADFYRGRVVTAQDVLLIVEVSDTTLRYDRGDKLPRYAPAGVPEVWIVDLADEQVEQYWQPVETRFSQRNLVRRGAIISSVMVPALRVSVDEVMG
jgi:Uma2 family endonuclease